jgi:hypothetical protein
MFDLVIHGGTVPERTHRFEDVLGRTRFGAPQQFFVPGIPDHRRDSRPMSTVADVRVGRVT